MIIQQKSRKRKASSLEKEPMISMYRDAPQEEVSIPEFERFALDRLQVLKALENLCAKNQRDAIPETLRKATRSLKLRGRKDHLSHFILRLAFCQTEESRRWLTEYEKQLFRYRFLTATSDAKDRFFETQKLNFSPMSRAQLTAEVGSSLAGWYGQDCNSFYKVSFEEALDLIRRRKVIIWGGFAYVDQKQLVTLLEARFRIHMNKQLARLARIRSSLKRDPRVGPLVTALTSGSAQASYKSTGYKGRVTLDMLPALAERSFPLCMENMYSKLKEFSHLRYEGRQTFGLFLKGVGLTMGESITFWRKAFARKIPADKFDKQYSYNIRHIYGQEGKRTDYTPHNCMRIIKATQGNGEFHGCPFKTFGEQHLRATLFKKKVSGGDIEEIVKLTKGFHFGIACQRYFVATHGGNPHDDLAQAVGNHPNQFFDQSWKYYKQKDETAAKKGGAKDGAETKQQVEMVQ